MTLSVQLDMNLPDRRTAAVAFVKRAANLDVARPLGGQLHLLNIGDASPSEVLHSYIHKAVSPFFDAYASKVAARTGAVERDGKAGARGTLGRARSSAAAWPSSGLTGLAASVRTTGGIRVWPQAFLPSARRSPSSRARCSRSSRTPACRG